jgi:hypothetical protein
MTVIIIIIIIIIIITVLLSYHYNVQNTRNKVTTFFKSSPYC